MEQNLSERLTDYLDKWYKSLPIQALTKIHGLEPNYLLSIPSDYFGEATFDLWDEFTAWELEDRINVHDTHYDEFYEFTKNINL